MGPGEADALLELTGSRSGSRSRAGRRGRISRGAPKPTIEIAGDRASARGCEDLAEHGQCPVTVCREFGDQALGIAVPHGGDDAIVGFE